MHVGAVECMFVRLFLQYKEPKRVVECLKKSGRIASQCMEKSVQVQLLVELVNNYMLFYEKGNSVVSGGDRVQI